MLIQEDCDSEIGQPRNPPWSREELILALELFLRNRKSPPGKTSEEVHKLSNELNYLRQCLGDKTTETLRNTAAVYLKLMNFRRFDPDYAAQGKVGMRHGNKLEATIWNEFFGREEELSRICRAIREGLQELSHEDRIESEDEITDAFEGRLLTRVHRLRERDPKLVRIKKKEALKSFGRLQCEVCHFDFFEKYGERGEGFIECHHTQPLQNYGDGKKTTVAELALLCANCHRMIHAARPWLTVNELKSIIR